MARAPRLVLPGLAHLVLLRGHDGAPVVRDDEDGAALVDALRLLGERSDVQIHGWRLDPSALSMMLRPADEPALARAVQWLGRRYVEAFNRRHGRSGTLWDGRFRSAVLQPGEATLQALCWLDRTPPEPLRGSSASRLGATLWPWLRQTPEYWALGNTPFDRERRWRQLLDEPLAAATVDRLGAALRSGRVFGEHAFVADLARQLDRPLVLRRPGRPARSAV